MKTWSVLSIKRFVSLQVVSWLCLLAWLLQPGAGLAQSPVCGNQASQEIRFAGTNLLKNGFGEFSDWFNNPPSFTNSVPPKRYSKRTIQGSSVITNPNDYAGWWNYSQAGWTYYGSYQYSYYNNQFGSKLVTTETDKFTGEETTTYAGVAGYSYGSSGHQFWYYQGYPPYYNQWTDNNIWSGVMDTNGGWVVTSKYSTSGWTDYYDPGLSYPEPWMWNSITITPTSTSYLVNTNFQDGYVYDFPPYSHDAYTWSQTLNGSQTETLSEEYTTDLLVTNTFTQAQGQAYPVDQDNQPLWSGGGGRAFNLISADELYSSAGKAKFRFTFQSETNMGYWIAYEMITNVYDHGILITGYSGLNIETSVISGNGSNVYSQEYTLDVPGLGYEIIVGACYIIPTNQPCVIFQPNPMFLCLSNAGVMTAFVFPPQAQSTITYELQEDVPGVAQISAAGTNLTVVGTAPGWATVLAKIGTNVIGAGALAVAKVTFPTNTIAVSLNGSWTFNVQVEPSSVPITFESSDTNVATLTTGSGAFTMTGVSLGSIQISARVGTNSVCSTAPGFVVDYTNATLVADRYLCEGGKGSVWVDLIPADALPDFTLTVTNSTGTNGMVVDITGGSYPLYEITGYNYGDTKVEAWVGSNLVARTDLTVVRIEFPVNTNGVIGIGLGDFALNTTMLPREAPVTYYSVNTNVVVASGSGRHLDLLGITNGTAEVRVKLGTNDLCNSVGVVVTNPGVAVNISFFPYLCEGASTPFTYTVNPPGLVTFDTSDHNVAVISGTNVVGVSYGETMVLALYNGIIAGSRRVTVVHVDFPDSEVAVGVDRFKPVTVHPTVLPESAAGVVGYVSEDALIALAGGSGTNLILRGVSDGRTKVLAKIGTTQLCNTVNVIVTNGCSSCESGNCATFGSLISSLSSVNVGINLGVLNSGKPTGFIRLRENNPSANLTTPAGLYVAADRSQVQAFYASGQLTQVRAPQGLINVRVINSTTFALDCYLKPAIGTGAGPYGTSGLQLQNTITFAGASSNTLITVTDTRNGQVESTYTFTWVSGNSNWRLITGYKQEEIATSIYGQNRYDTHSTFTYTNGMTPVLVSKAQRSYFQFAWGWALTQEVLDPDVSRVTTIYTYDGEGRLLQVNRPDGTWEAYGYNTNGLLAQALTPFGMSGWADSRYCRAVDYDYTPLPNSGDDGTVEPDRPRRTIESVYGKEVSRSFAVFLPGEEREIRCASVGAVWNNTNNLVTVTKRHTSGDFEGEIISVARPDGVLELRDNEITAQTNRVTTVDVGQPDTGGTSIIDGTRTITTTGPEGQFMSVTNLDIATGAVVGREIYSNYDSYDRPQRITYLDGTYRDTLYGCCGLDSERDRDGVTVAYLYDSLKRPYLAVRSGHQAITTITVYDGAGRVLSTRRKGEDNTEIVQQRLGYDLAGRLKAETNALMGVTTYAYGTNSSPSLYFRSTTNPDGGTRMELFQRDGSLYQVTGTAATPVRYEVGQDGNQLFTKEIRLTAVGNPTDEQTKTWRDALGRTVTISYGFITNNYYVVNGQYVSYEQFGPSASLNYNVKGQLIRQIDPDGVMTQFAYNALGEQEWTAVDMDQNWVMESSQGQDRVTRSVRDVVGGASPYRRTRTYVLPSTNSGTTLLVSEARISADGLRQWQISLGLTNYSETTFGPNDYRTNTVIAPDATRTVSTYHRGTLLATERVDGTYGNRLGRVDYAYDPHGRVWVVTDARTGGVTNSYNAADLVTASTSQAASPGTAWLTVSAVYDVLGRPTRVTQPDWTTVTNEYYLTGALKKTYGSRTYPVEYTYDPQGRMTSMKTWQSFATGSGAAVTTWGYDSRRGWLGNKRYQDSNGVDYAYSGAGRLTARTWARGNPRAATQYGYDHAGDLSSVSYVNAPGPNVSYTRDRLGRVTRITQGTNIVNRTYNDAGQVLSEVRGNGPLNGLGTSYTYDSLLRRDTMAATTGGSPTDLPGMTRMTYTYDYRGVLNNVWSFGAVAAYAYVADSTVVERVDLKDGSVLRASGTRTFDAVGRLTSLTWRNPANAPLQSAGYDLNTAGQRTKVTQADGSYWLYDYDALGQVKSGKRYWASGQAVLGQQFDYRFDDIGNRRLATTGNGRQANYHNNLLNEVTDREVPSYVNVAGTVHASATVTINDQPPAATRQGTYYFKEFQLLNIASAKWVGLTNLAVLKGTGTNMDREISQVGWAYLPQTPEGFTYDLDGNLLSDGRWLYSWDGENRLTGLESIGGTPTAAKAKLVFEHDWMGRRTRKLSYTWNPTLMGGSYVLAQERRFIYDGWNLVAELDGSNGPVRTYSWGPDLSGSLQGAGGVGGLLGLVKWRQVSIGGQPGYTYDARLGVLGDGNGNVTGLLDMGTGTQVAAYEYGPFGEGLRASGLWARENPFRFSTKYQDEETDLYYYGYRYYNASTGRWLGRDPIEEEGGINLHGFIRNDGINAIDLYGLEPKFCSDAKKWLKDKAQSVYDWASGANSSEPDPWQMFYNYAHGGTPQLWGGAQAQSSFVYNQNSQMVKSLIASDLFQKQVLPKVREQVRAGKKSDNFTASLESSPWYQPFKDITGFATRGYVWQDFHVSFVGTWGGKWQVVDACCEDGGDVIIAFKGFNRTSASSNTRTPWPRSWRYGPYPSLQEEIEGFDWRHPISSVSPFSSVLKNNPLGPKGPLTNVDQLFEFTVPVRKD